MAALVRPRAVAAAHRASRRLPSLQHRSGVSTGLRWGELLEAMEKLTYKREAPDHLVGPVWCC